MNKKILVVGGTGFIGYHLIKFLKNKNFAITSVSTNKPKKIRKLNGVNYLHFDISNYKKFKILDEKFDYVVNFGGYVDHSNKKLTYKSHFIGCKNLAKFFEKKKITSFIQIGSSLEYGKLKSPQSEKKGFKPNSIYAKSKFLATQFLLRKYKQKKFPVIILRGYQIYGPKQDANRLISTVIINCIKNKEFNCSSGEQFRDFLHVDDFINAIYKSLDNKKAIGKIINIGYGKSIKVKKVILIINKFLKKGFPKFNKIKLRKDEMMILYPSIKRASEILNWKPKINFVNGLKNTILDYKKTFK